MVLPVLAVLANWLPLLLAHVFQFRQYPMVRCPPERSWLSIVIDRFCPAVSVIGARTSPVVALVLAPVNEASPDVVPAGTANSQSTKLPAFTKPKSSGLGSTSVVLEMLTPSGPPVSRNVYWNVDAPPFCVLVMVTLARLVLVNAIDPPAVPTLIAPAGTTVVSKPPLLAWSSVTVQSSPVGMPETGWLLDPVMHTFNAWKVSPKGPLQFR